jgi:hypothetical protein
MRAEGWIEHDGKSCPVPRDAIVRAIIREIDGGMIEPSGRYAENSARPAWDWHWGIDQTKSGAIIAYRIEGRQP